MRTFQDAIAPSGEAVSELRAEDDSFRVAYMEGLTGLLIPLDPEYDSGRQVVVEDDLRTEIAAVIDNGLEAVKDIFRAHRDAILISESDLSILDKDEE